MNSNTMQCDCGFCSFNNENLENHKFKFKDLDYKIIQLLKNYIVSDNSLIHIKYLLQEYIKLIDEKKNFSSNYNILNNNIKEKDENDCNELEDILAKLEKIKEESNNLKNIIDSNSKNMFILEETVKKEMESEDDSLEMERYQIKRKNNNLKNGKDNPSKKIFNIIKIPKN